MRQPVNPRRAAKPINFIGACRTIGDAACQPHVVILRFGLDGRHDAIHCKNRIEVIGCNHNCPVSMLQRRREAAAHHIAQHIENHHIRIFEEMVLLEQLDGLPHDIAAAAGASRRTAGFHAHHAIEALEHIVIGPQFLVVEIMLFQHVDHGGHQFLGQREGAVMLGIATDLQHALAEQGESRGQIGRCCRFADAALAINRKHLGAFDLLAGIERDLHAAFAITSSSAIFQDRCHLLILPKPPRNRRQALMRPRLQVDLRLHRWQRKAPPALQHPAANNCDPPLR